MTPVTLINTLSIKPGHIDEFIAIQKEFTAQQMGRSTGLVGGRIYRSADGNTIVLVSQFESKEAQQEVLQSAPLREHIARQQPLVLSSAPTQYEEAFTYGLFQ